MFQSQQFKQILSQCDFSQAQNISFNCLADVSYHVLPLRARFGAGRLAFGAATARAGRIDLRGFRVGHRDAEDWRLVRHNLCAGGVARLAADPSVRFADLLDLAPERRAA